MKIFEIAEPIVKECLIRKDYETSDKDSQLLSRME
jgi:hypothetical protein